MNDATIAAWESKYYYNRARPSELDHKLATAVGRARQPVVSIRARRDGVGGSDGARSLAPGGSQLVPGDGGRGGELASVGRPSVSERRRCGRGARPQGRRSGYREGRSGWLRRYSERRAAHGPLQVGGNEPRQLRRAELASDAVDVPDQFRPPPPPVCHSAQVTQEVADVRNFPRSPAAFATNYKAFYWQSPEGLNTWVYRYADKWMFEDGVHLNPPRAARVLCAHRRDAVRCIHREPGRGNFVLVSAGRTSSTRLSCRSFRFPTSRVIRRTTRRSPRRVPKCCLSVPDARGLLRAIGKEAGDSTNLGRHSLPDGQRRRREPRPFGRRPCSSRGRSRTAHSSAHQGPSPFRGLTEIVTATRSS